MKTLIHGIIKSLTKEELRNLGITRITDYGKGRTRIYRVVVKEELDPVSFCDVFLSDDYIDLVIATERNSRESGYAQKALERGLVWINCHPEVCYGKEIRWVTRSKNYPSVQMALRNGFILEKREKDESGEVWSHFLLF